MLVLIVQSVEQALKEITLLNYNKNLNEGKSREIKGLLEGKIIFGYSRVCLHFFIIIILQNGPWS